ncbi:MAG TPA: hypothetical protein VF897_20555, partial [Roseiflexaceae bacterium]
LDDDALSRQRAGRRTTTSGAARRQSGATGRLYDDAEATYAPRPSATLRWLLPIVIVALLALALAFWLISSRTTVTVAPPASTAGAHPFNGEVIPLAAAGSSAGTAVQASPVTAEAAATVPGQVQTETLSPSGTAKGVVTIINTIANPVPLPKGSEFIGKNEKGQEVRFTLDADTTVPPAVTSSSLTGSSTTYGQIDAAITARSPGSASNVPENSITQLLIPGQQPIVSQNSNFIFQNAAITGGSEEKQRIVTEGDVQGVLQAALTQLYNSGVQQLGAQIDGAKFQIDQTTIAPSAAELGSPQSYEPPVVEPPVGQAVDPNNPNFKVTVRARFSALATPKGKLVGEQLKTVAPQYLVQRGGSPCKAAERPATSVTNWRWDGQKLTIDGSISCLPATGLPPDVIGRVKDALRGQTRDAAETSLRALQQQGLIGEYALPPDKASFPRFDWLITVNVVEPPPVQQQPTQKATS